MILDGHPVIIGTVVSLTVTVNEHEAVLLEASVAVYVTVVTPSGKTLPGLCELVSVTLGQLSVTVGTVQVAVD